MRLHELKVRTRLMLGFALMLAMTVVMGVLAMRSMAAIEDRLDDVVNATPSDVLARFRAAATEVVGGAAANEIEQRVAALETAGDVGAIVALFRGKAH